MKKSILLSVGVMLLISSMTLTTTAFGQNENFCFIKQTKENRRSNSCSRSTSYRYNLYVPIETPQELSPHMSSTDRNQIIKTALEFEKAGMCDASFFCDFVEKTCTRINADK